MNTRTFVRIRRSLAIIGILSILSTLVVSIPTASAAYTGADAEKAGLGWAKDAVDAACEKEIIDCSLDAKFKEVVNRAVGYQMLTKGFGVWNENALSPLKGLGDWYDEAFHTAYTLGWTQGDPAPNANPGGNMTRAQLAVASAAVLGLEAAPGELSTYTDAGSVPSWAKGALGAMVKAKLMGQGGAKTLRPNEGAIKAEVIVVLNAQVDYAEENEIDVLEVAAERFGVDAETVQEALDSSMNVVDGELVAVEIDEEADEEAEEEEEEEEEEEDEAPAEEEEEVGTTTPVVAEGALVATFLGPASAPKITTQSLAPLADFKFMGNGTVTAVKLKRLGISADTTLTNVYLFDGDKRLTDAASVGSGSVINFSDSAGLFTVATEKTISVKADMAGTSGETVGIELTSVTLSSGTITGLPLAGNLHTMSAATLATAAFTAATASGNADPGKDVLVWQSTATISTRDLAFSRLSLRQIGSINATDINNFRLFIDGVQIGTEGQSLDSNGYVTFSFAQTLVTGARIVKVIADVNAGSGRTIQMSLRGAFDLSFKDTQYDANIVATATGNFPLGPVAFTVNAGTMTVVKAADSQSQNVTTSASDASLAKYTFTAYGEKIKVETLRVGIITTGGTVTDHTLRNVRILVNGAQVGSTTSVPAAAAFLAASGTSFTTNFNVSPGTPVTVEIRADIFDNEGTNDIATPGATALQALLVGGAATSNAIPSVSLGTINVPSQTNVLGNSLTIASGSISLSLASNYAAQTVVVPQSAYKLGAFNLIGNATEAVTINTFELDFTQTTGTSFDASDDLTDLYIQYGTQTSTVKGSVTDADNTFSVSFTLEKNESKTLNVFATLGSTVTAADAIRADFTVTGITANSVVTVYADTTSTNTTKDAGFSGQVITAGTGSITVSVDASRPNSALFDDSGTLTSAAFKFDAVNDTYTITDLTFTLVNASAVQNLILKEGTTVLITKPAATTVTINGLSISIAPNVPKVLTVDLQMGAVGVGAGTTGSSVLTTLTSATARSSQGTSAAVTESPADPAGQVMYVYKSVPTITNVALPSSLLVAGTVTLSKFSLSTGSAGTIGWGKLLFTVTKNVGGTDTLATPTLWDVTSGATQIAGTVLFGGGVEADNDTAGTITFIPNSEQQVTGSKTYELRVTLGGAPIVGDSVTTQITQPSAFAASVAAFSINTASSVTYYDADNGATVTAGDVRQTAQDQYTAPTVAVADNVTGHNVATSGITQAFSTATAGNGAMTLTLPEFTTDNVINGATFTVTGAGSTGVTCTPFTGTDGTGAVTTQVTLFSAIQSVTCTGTGFSLLLRSLTVVNDGLTNVSNPGLVIVVTKGTDYAIGSTAVALDSDLALAVTGGVAPAASFVWSDLSASGHAPTTTDWTNGNLVKDLPTNTQNLSK